MVNQGLRAASASERVFEVIDAFSAVREAADAKDSSGVEGRVRFDHVSFAYSSGHTVLDDVTIDAEPGQTIALLGETASGRARSLTFCHASCITSGAITD